MSSFLLTTEQGRLSGRRVAVREAVSELFQLDVMVRVGDANLDLSRIVGKPATVTVSDDDRGAGAVRRWVGIVSRMELEKGVRREGTREASTESTYRARVVPRLWLATRRKNHRIFQKLTIPDIVSKILEHWGVEASWSGVDRAGYPQLEYKVQYGETDFDFVARLLEEAGIAFVWSTEDAGDTIVFTDQMVTTPPRVHPAPIVFEDTAVGHHAREWVGDLAIEHEVRPGKHTLQDFDFRNPAYVKRSESKSAPGEEAELEIFEYTPGSFLVVEEGSKDTPAADAMLRARYTDKHGRERTTVSMEAERTGRRVVRFESNVRSLQPGTELVITNHPHELLEKKLVVIELRFEGIVEQAWSVHVAAVFADEPYRPAQRTPKASVHGVQSATVVGPKSGGPGAENLEIHTDEFGRVRVQFPWDREGGSNEHSSCWMRVAQGWAGAGYGLVNLPRVGQEVLVGFLGGDPDQPMVMGRVFNALNPVPYKLPEHKTQSGWRSWSSPKAHATDPTPYNELKFEDDATKELVWFQAQRDLHRLVKHNEVALIKRHDVRTVGKNQHHVVKQNKRELVMMDDHLHVVGDRLQKIDGSTSLTVGVDQDVKVGTKHAIEAGSEIHLKAGATLVLEAGSKLSLKGPGGFIDIHGGGVDIAGTLVKINSGGSPADGSGAAPQTPNDPMEAEPRDESSPDGQYDEGGTAGASSADPIAAIAEAMAPVTGGAATAGAPAAAGAGSGPLDALKQVGKQIDEASTIASALGLPGSITGPLEKAKSILDEASAVADAVKQLGSGSLPAQLGAAKTLATKVGAPAQVTKAIGAAEAIAGLGKGGG